MNPPSEPTQRKYWAFISYSQENSDWGAWLLRALESYSVPKELVGRDTGRGDPVPNRVFPVFRDRDELPTAANFETMLKDALAASRYLIVLCSPAAVKSRWVNEEIRHFKSLGRSDRIICLIIDGEPNATDRPELGADRECFPEAIRFHVDSEGNITDERTEPIAADVRPGKDSKQHAKLKILAGLLGVNFDDLARRDHARQQRRMIIWASVATFLLVVMTSLAVLFLLERNRAQEALGSRYLLAAREANQTAAFGEAILYYDAARELGQQVENDPGFAGSWSKAANLYDEFQTRRAVTSARFCGVDDSSLLLQDQTGNIYLRSVTERHTPARMISGNMQCDAPRFGKTTFTGIVGGNLTMRSVTPPEVEVYSKALSFDPREIAQSENGDLIYYRKLPAPPEDLEFGNYIIHVDTDKEVKLEAQPSLNHAAWWFHNRRIYRADKEQMEAMKLSVWDVDSGSLIGSRGIQQVVTCHQHTDTHLVIGFANGYIAGLDPENLEIQWTAAPEGMPAPAVAFDLNADNKLVCFDAMHQLRLIDPATGQVEKQYKTGSGPSEVAVIRGDVLLTGGKDKIVRYWRDGQLEATFSWHEDEITALDLSRDGKMIVSSQRNGVSRIWKLNENPSQPLIENTELPESLAIHTETKCVIGGETFVATLTDSGSVEIRRDNSEEIHILSPPSARSAGSDVLFQNAAQPGEGIAFSPNGRYLAASQGFVVYLWDWRNGMLAWTSPTIPAGMFGGVSVASFASDSQITVVEGKPPKAAWRINLPDEIPDAKAVDTFGQSVLGLSLKNGRLQADMKEQ